MKKARLRPVIGYPSYYVSDQGEVFRKYGDELRPLKRTAGKRDGDLQVALSRDGIPKTKAVHRLVLEAFVGPRPEGKQTYHINGEVSDNRLSNLTWGTSKENAANRIRRGVLPYGEKHWNSKLTKKVVIAIRRSKLTAKAVGQKFGVAQGTVDGIRQRKQWKQV